MEELGVEELGVEELGVEELGVEELGVEELAARFWIERKSSRAFASSSAAEREEESIGRHQAVRTSERDGILIFSGFVTWRRMNAISAA